MNHTNILKLGLEGEKVSVVNNIFNSLWSSINIRLNGTEITDPSSRWYSYKSYFENLLSYSSATKENILSFKGFIKDDPKKYDEVGNASVISTNNGYVQRQLMFDFQTRSFACLVRRSVTSPAKDSHIFRIRLQGSFFQGVLARSLVVRGSPYALCTVD